MHIVFPSFFLAEIGRFLSFDRDYQFFGDLDKVNSVQEACAKYFAVHLLKFEILQTTQKNKNIKMLDLLAKN